VRFDSRRSGAGGLASLWQITSGRKCTSMRDGVGLEAVLRLKIVSGFLFLFICYASLARAGVTLLLGEPYGHDGAFAGTGHAAVYLSHVCATSPVMLRPCAPGESGIVLSRYLGIGGYDWIAIPLVPYLYAVEEQENIPLFANEKVVAFLRDRYRRDHLESLIPDLPDGATPDGNWYELIGASYLRTIYSFELDSSPEQDAQVIRILNNQSNRQRWKLVTANCADFVRQILSLYYPHSVHRGIIGDLGVTTPKQLGRTFSRYSSRHRELQASNFVIPQVPGTIARSKRMKGVFEVMLTAKKYMWPIVLFHPYAASTAIAVYVQHWHFNPGKNAPILDSTHQMAAALTSTERRASREQLEELVKAHSPASTGADQRLWKSLYTSAKPALDAEGGVVLQVSKDGKVSSVGITRSNILNLPDASEFAAGLVKARLHEELGSAARKTARSDVGIDLNLLRQLLSLQPKQIETTARLAAGNPATAHRGLDNGPSAPL
jgi:hypothetical protein